MPLLVTSSGQRHFLWPGHGDSDSGSSSGSEDDSAVMPSESAAPPQDNALTIWWAGPLAPSANEVGEKAETTNEGEEMVVA